MAANGEGVKSSLREVLADSQISAVAVAVLLLWSLDAAFRGLSTPFAFTVGYLFDAITSLGLPDFYSTRLIASRFVMVPTLSYLFSASVSLAAAWLLSRCVYGAGSFRSLRNYRSTSARRSNA